MWKKKSKEEKQKLKDEQNKKEKQFLEKLIIPDTLDVNQLKFDQWNLYVQMADKISSRRASANNFFLTSNSILIVAISFMVEFLNLYWVFLPLIIGLVFSISWFYLISNYRSLNTAKFKVINELEEQMYFRGFTIEWDLLEHGRGKLHKPLSKIEQYIPITLGIVYLVSAIILACNI